MIDEIIADRKPVLVDFWAPWCQPCKTLKGVLDEVSKTYSDRVKFVFVNVELTESQELANRFSVRSLPTVLLFKDGQFQEQVRGKDENSIKSLLDRYV